VWFLRGSMEGKHPREVSKHLKVSGQGPHG
jgi:hypothetical protein